MLLQLQRGQINDALILVFHEVVGIVAKNDVNLDRLLAPSLTNGVQLGKGVVHELDDLVGQRVIFIYPGLTSRGGAVALVACQVDKP